MSQPKKGIALERGPQDLAARFARRVLPWILLFACSCADVPVGPMPDPNQNPDPEPTPPSGWYWQNPLPQGSTLMAVSFTDANTGTAVGQHGTILRTETGGI